MSKDDDIINELEDYKVITSHVMKSLDNYKLNNVSSTRRSKVLSFSMSLPSENLINSIIKIITKEASMREDDH